MILGIDNLKFVRGINLELLVCIIIIICKLHAIMSFRSVELGDPPIKKFVAHLYMYMYVRPMRDATVDLVQIDN